MRLVYDLIRDEFIEIGSKAFFGIWILIFESDARGEPSEGDCIKQTVMLEIRNAVALTL